MKYLSLALLFMFTGTVMAGTTNYYYGSVNFYSADGLKPQGSSVSLVKRMTEPENNLIREIVTQPSRHPDEQPIDIVTDMVRKKGTNVFTVSEPGGSFSGTLTFSGPEWDWNAWTYDVVLKDGGTITGSGSLSAETGIQTNKKLELPAVTLKMVESLQPIGEDEYEQIKNEMSGVKMETSNNMSKAGRGRGLRCTIGKRYHNGACCKVMSSGGLHCPPKTHKRHWGGRRNDG